MKGKQEKRNLVRGVRFCFFFLFGNLEIKSYLDDKRISHKKCQIGTFHFVFHVEWFFDFCLFLWREKSLHGQTYLDDKVGANFIYKTSLPSKFDKWMNENFILNVGFSQNFSKKNRTHLGDNIFLSEISFKASWINSTQKRRKNITKRTCFYFTQITHISHP